MLEASDGIQSEGHIFRPAQQHAREHALFALTADIHRFGFVVESSDNAFRLIGAGMIALGLLPLFVTINDTAGRDLGSIGSMLLVSFFSIGVFLVMLRFRRRRRAWLPEFTEHYAQEAVVFTDHGFERQMPVPLSYRVDFRDKLGRCEVDRWSYGDIERVSVFRSAQGRVTALDIAVAGEPWVLNHFTEKELLAEMLKNAAPSLARVEEHPRLVPIWTRVLLGGLAVVMVAGFLWLLGLN